MEEADVEGAGMEGAAEVGAAEVGAAEVGAAERGAAERGAAERGAGLAVRTMREGPAPGGRFWQALLARRVWLEVILLLFWLLTLVRPTLSNGDAACYLTQILQHDFSSRTIHIGYLWSATPWMELLPWGPAVRLNLLSVAWGLAGWAALRRLERIVAPGRAPGLAGLCWLVSSSVLLELTTAEVYPAQLALLLWALVAWGDERPVVSGMLWAAAMTVSPTSLAALPAFLYRARSRRDWGLLLGVGLVPIAMLAGWLRADYLEGPRGLLSVSEGMRWDEALWFRLDALPRTLGWGLAGTVTAILAVLGGQWPAGRRLLMAIGLHALAVWLLVDRYRDVPAHSLTIAMLALLTAEGAWRLSGPSSVAAGEDQAPRPGRVGWAAVAILLAIQGVSVDQAARAERRREAAFAALSRRVYASMPAEGRLVGSWSERRLYEWYAVGRAPAELTLELSPAAFNGPGVRRLLRTPQAGSLPVGGQVRLEADGAWTYVPGGGPEAGVP